MSMHRIGIVGCGGIANAHIQGYRQVAAELGEVVAGCDVERQAVEGFCDRYDVPLRFTDPRALIESGEVDVISVLTPAAVRGEIIFPAADQGIHLLVEKPFAPTLAEARSLVEAAEAKGVTLAVNQQFRFMPGFVEALDIVRSGAIGELRYVEHHHFQDRTRVGGWRKDEERLEISIFSIHLVDRLQYLVGSEPQTVSAVTRHWNPETRGETFAALTIQFADGVVAAMVSNWHSPGLPECRLRADGTAGSLLLTGEDAAADPYRLAVRSADGRLSQRESRPGDVFVTAMGESMRQLLLAIDGGSSPPHSGRDNLKTMAIVDAAYESAGRGGGSVEARWRAEV